VAKAKISLHHNCSQLKLTEIVRIKFGVANISVGFSQLKAKEKVIEAFSLISKCLKPEYFFSYLIQSAKADCNKKQSSKYCSWLQPTDSKRKKLKRL